MVKFISYIDNFPEHCNGSLTLEINDKRVRFGNNIDDTYERFWESGGEARHDKGGAWHIYRRPWIIHKEKLPSEYQPFVQEIEEVLNNNVLWGCCLNCL